MCIKVLKYRSFNLTNSIFLLHLEKVSRFFNGTDEVGEGEEPVPIFSGRMRWNAGFISIKAIYYDNKVQCGIVFNKKIDFLTWRLCDFDRGHGGPKRFATHQPQDGEP